jgi:hypothetical protein
MSDIAEEKFSMNDGT